MFPVALLFLPAYETPGMRVWGWVAGSCGETLRRAQVTLVDRSTRRVIATTGVDSDAEFEFRNVPPGSYALRAEAPGAEGSAKSFEAAAGADTDELQLFVDTHPPAGMCFDGDMHVHPGKSVDEASGWKTFTSRAGWQIKYPPGWDIGSCVQCTDPAAPDTFVMFSEPATKRVLMIEPLADQPADQNLDDWLRNVGRSTELNPVIREEWIALDGVRALKIVTRSPDNTESENIYLVKRTTTFALRADASPALRSMISTFKFTR